MHIFDLLVLAALFVPIALIVAGNLAAYRTSGRSDGIFGADGALARMAAQPAQAAGIPSAAPQKAAELPELRRAA